MAQDGSFIETAQDEGFKVFVNGKEVMATQVNLSITVAEIVKPPWDESKSNEYAQGEMSWEVEIVGYEPSENQASIGVINGNRIRHYGMARYKGQGIWEGHGPLFIERKGEKPSEGMTYWRQ